MQEAGKLAKQGSKDDNEALIALLLYEGYLQLDFSCTAYATNCYLKLASMAGLLLQGVCSLSIKPVWASSLPMHIKVACLHPGQCNHPETWLRNDVRLTNHSASRI